MMSYDLYKMQTKVQKHMDEERYRHTLGVMYTSASLAMKYQMDIQKAQVAGLLHDCAKCMDNHEKIKLCEKNNIPINKTEYRNPFLLHAKLGAFLAREKYHIEDEEILNAVMYHTTGKPSMTILEQIVFIADYIEPARYKAANLDMIRKTAFEDLDLCCYYILKDTLEFLKEHPGHVDDMTEKAYHYYRGIVLVHE